MAGGGEGKNDGAVNGSGDGGVAEIIPGKDGIPTESVGNLLSLACYPSEGEVVVG